MTQTTIPPAATPAPPVVPSGAPFDRQDALLIVGVVSLLAGIGMRSIPAALIALGIICLAAVWLIQVEQHRQESKGADGSAGK